MHAIGVVFVRHGRSLLAVLLLTIVLTLGFARDATAEPAGDVIIAWHVTLASSWLDPATAPPQITPFAVLYALHDALIRPLAGQHSMLIHLTADFPVTSEDVKFSYERYKGAGAKEFQARPT